MTTTCDTTRDIVKQYYSALKSTSDLKTSACCTTSSVPPHVRSILQNIHQEVKDKYYGCGFVCPPLLEGLTVVDLGCGFVCASFYDDVIHLYLLSYIPSV